MKKSPNIPAWMKSGRPDTIHKNCLHVQDGLVEACDFDPAMCQECESTNCKWHPSKPGAGRDVEELEEDEDEDDDVESDDESDHEAGDREEDDERY